MIENFRKTSRRFKIKIGVYFLFSSGILLGLAFFNPTVIIYNPESEQYEPLDFTGIRFALDNDESVDADSNVDAVGNIGSENATYTAAQSLDGSYQGITEATAGGGVTNNTDYLFNNTDDNWTPSDVGSYSSTSNMNSDDGSYNTLTETQTGNQGFNVVNDVDSNTSDIDTNQDNGVETDFDEAQGTTLDSTYMNIAEQNTTTGEGFLIKQMQELQELGDPDLASVWSYGAGEGYGFNSITNGINTIYDENRGVWLNNASVQAKLLNCTYITAFDGFDLACYHGIYAGKDIWFYPQNTTLRKGSEGIAMRPNQLRYYQLSTGDSQKWVDASVVDPTYDPNDDFKRIQYSGVYPATTYNFWYDRGSIKEIINMSALPNQYPVSPYPLADTYLIHVQDIIMKDSYIWFDDDGAITDTKWNLTGDLRLTQSGKLLGVFPTGLVWSSISGQRVESQVVASLVRISDTQWQLGSALPYNYLTNSNRDDHVYIDPTWDVGLDEGDWNNNTEMINAYYNTTYNAVMIDNTSIDDYNMGVVKSIIKVANAHWQRIRFYGNINDGEVRIFFNHSSNPVQDPYEATYIIGNAQSGTIYQLPSLAQEKFGQWIIALIIPDNISISPQIFNVTLYNDDLVAFYDPTSDVQTGWNDGTGSSPWYTEIDNGDRAPDTPASLADYIQENTQNAVSEHNFGSVSEDTINTISIWSYLTTGSNRYIDMDCEEDGTPQCTTTSVPLDITETWYYANWSSMGGVSVGQMSEVFTCVKQGGGAPANCIIYNAYMAVIYSPPNNPYILDFEYQWTSVAEGSWDNQTVTLAIYLQNDPATEDLKVYYWTSSWITIGDITTTGWNNFTSAVTIGLTAVTHTIRFVGDNETVDDTADSWNIDLIIIHTIEPESRVNRFDREVAFLNVTQSSGGGEGTPSGSSSGDESENGDFETGDGLNWTTGGSCSGVSATATDNPHEGTYHGKITGCATAQYGTLTYDYDFNETFAGMIGNFGVNVTASVWVDAPSLGTIEEVRFSAMWSVTELDIITRTVDTGGGYKEYNVTSWTLPYGTEVFRTQVYFQDTIGGGTWDVDFFQLNFTYFDYKNAVEGIVDYRASFNGSLYDDGWWEYLISGDCGNGRSTTGAINGTHSIRMICNIAEENDITLRMNITDYSNDIDLGGIEADLFAWVNATAVSGSVTTAYWEILDSAFAVIDTINTTSITGEDPVAINVLDEVILSGGRYIRFRLENDNSVGSGNNFANIDNIFMNLTFIGSVGGGSKYNYTDVELVVNTGSLDADEVISVYQYNVTETTWVFITNLTSAASWTNISIINNVTQNIYFSFVDTNQTVGVDFDTDAWEIDYFALHLWNETGSIYKLEWEHQAQSLPAYSSDNAYALTIYGSYTQGASETIDLEMWNSSSSAWVAAVSLTILSTDQWYNATISCGVDDPTGVCDTTMTWRFFDSDQVSDSTEDELSIDYSGVYIYSLAVVSSDSDPVNVTAIPNGIDTEFNQFPFNITVDAGQEYDLEIKCADVNVTACANGWIYYDIDSNPSGYTQLLTTYTTIYSSQSRSITELEIYLWANIPTGQIRQTHEVTISFRISLA